MLQPNTEIKPDFVSYGDVAYNWAAICKVLKCFDCDVIENDVEWALFVTWQESIRNAVIAAMALSWLDERSRANVWADINEYL
jgi:hypothetical protein